MSRNIAMKILEKDTRGVNLLPALKEGISSFITQATGDRGETQKSVGFLSHILEHMKVNRL